MSRHSGVLTQMLRVSGVLVCLHSHSPAANREALRAVVLASFAPLEPPYIVAGLYPRLE